MMRGLLYEAATVLLTRAQNCCSLKAWTMAVAKRRGLQKAFIALVRHLAVTLDRIWADGAEFRWTGKEALVVA